MWADYACGTGFATVAGNIARQLVKNGYELDVVGINYDGGPYDDKKWPGRIWPAMNPLQLQANYGDVYGRQWVLDRLASNDYDILFMIQDTFIIQGFIKPIKELQKGKPFATVCYFPIDAAPKQDWITQVVAEIDFPVAYTKYAKAECEKIMPKLNLPVIYHGTNLEDFRPLPKDFVAEFRAKYFGPAADKFIVMNLNRNQSRKDVMRTFMVAAELKRRGINDVVWYMHMQQDDVGGNLLVMADHFGLQRPDDFMYPDPRGFTAHNGFPVEVVNSLYNAVDCVFTSTLGEGWGLSLTEAMATKTPIIAPDNTSITEILADGRGQLVPSGNSPSMWVLKELDNERLRPLMDVERAADAIVRLRSVPDRLRAKSVETAYKWAQELSWESVCVEWLKIFAKAAQASKDKRALLPKASGPILPNRKQRREMARKQ